MRKFMILGKYTRKNDTVSCVVVTEKGIAGYQRPIHTSVVEAPTVVEAPAYNSDDDLMLFVRMVQKNKGAK